MEHEVVMKLTQMNPDVMVQVFKFVALARQASLSWQQPGSSFQKLVQALNSALISSNVVSRRLIDETGFGSKCLLSFIPCLARYSCFGKQPVQWI